jgi:hypothetical protein
MFLFPSTGSGAGGGGALVLSAGLVSDISFTSASSSIFPGFSLSPVGGGGNDTSGDPVDCCTSSTLADGN